MFQKTTMAVAVAAATLLLAACGGSNGDNNGDLNGVRLKLDYLQDLGITTIMLLPLYDADCYHNYFANDFDKIDAEFGTINDLSNW